MSLYVTKKVSNSTMIVWLICVSSLVLTFFSHYIGVSLLTIISVGIMCTGVFFLPNNKKLAILFCALPWIQVLKIDSTQPTLYHLLFFIFVLVLLKDIKKINIKILIMIITFVIYILCVRLLNQNEMEYGVLPYILSLIFMVLLFPNLKQYYKADICLDMFSLGLITAFIAERLYRDIPSMNVYLSNDTYAHSEAALRYGGLSNDANFTAMLVLIYLCFVVSSVENLNSSKIRKVSIILSSLVVIIFTFFTVSKMFFLGLIIISVFVILKKIKDYKLSTVVQYLLTIGIFIFTSYKLGYFDGIIYRLSLATDIESITTGRSSILSQYQQFLFSEGEVLFFGIGMYDRVYYEDKSTHNTIISAVYQLGIMGILLIYIPLMISLIRMAVLSLGTNVTKVSFLPIIILFLCMMSLDILMYEGLPLLLVIIIVCTMQQSTVSKRRDSHVKDFSNCSGL
ncbi:hypothetical protein IEO70_02015 [Bacillus sp. AGMB 02131]|uniref:O-antigen ligase domain-containing protein n=1 Tax=Peribacillus faecalis TaxID=2772559 RepID=A0A927CXJ0_9BACI|nr:hypothetical protein [Peribacillus faecalis]MBD3107144.1 hypothetical protein [Peribacillus faecalis]